MSRESLAINSKNFGSRNEPIKQPVKSSKNVEKSVSQPIFREETVREAITTLETETLHSETSWGKLSNHVNNLGLAADEVSSIGLLSVSHLAPKSQHSNGKLKSQSRPPPPNEEPPNKVISHREKKRRAERRLSSSLADFGGTTTDLQDLFIHATETLHMYSPAATRKLHNKGNVVYTEGSTTPEVVEIGRKRTDVSTPVKTTQEIELDMLLSAVVKNGDYNLDSRVVHALKKANKSVDQSTAAPIKNGTSVVFGTYLSEELIESILSESQKYLPEDIGTTTKTIIVETSILLRKSGRTDVGGEQRSNIFDSPKANKTDDLGEMFRAACARSPRVDQSLGPLGATSPPEPPNFTAMAAEHSKRRSSGSIDVSKKRRASTGNGPCFAANFSDSLVEMAFDGEDDLKKLYKNAYGEAPRVGSGNDNGVPPSFLEKSPPVPKFETFKPESRAMSTGDLKSPPLERRTPILARFLELNRQEQLERTHSGREIPMVSPVTEPTMEGWSIIEDAKARLMALAQSMPDLEDAPQTANDSPEKKQNIEHDQNNSKDTDQFSGSHSRIEEASFDTFQELEAILTETKREYGTELSMDLVTAIKKAATAEAEHDSLHDSVSLLMEHIVMESDAVSTDESSLHGIAIELKKRLSSSAASETSKSLSDLIHSLRSKLTESRNTDKYIEPTARASKHYLSNLVDIAQAELGNELPFEIADTIRRSSVGADRTRNPPVSWEDLEVLLQEVCEEQDENSWFEIQEAFFRAWEKCQSQSVGRKTPKWGQSSGYFSALSESEGSISVLMDDPDDVNYLEDIVEEVRRIHGGEVPREVVDRLKERLRRSFSDLEYSKDFGDSSKGSGFFKGSAQSFNFDYSQSTFSSGVSPLTYSPLLNQKPKVKDMDGLDGLDLIEEGRSQSQSSSGSSKRERHSDDKSKEEIQESASSLKRMASKSNSTVSSLSTSGDTHDSDDDYSVDLKSSTERSTERNSSDSAGSGSTDQRSAPISVVMPSNHPTIERSHSAQSIHSTQSVTVNKNLGPDILKELKKKYSGPIPEGLVLVLTQSVAIPYSMNSDEDLSIIFQEYESVCHKALPADLVLVLREASVSLRNSSHSSRSRRSRLIRQSSGSFRSTSRSSGMPSISETGTDVLVTRKFSQPEIVPGEIKTDHPARTMPVLHPTMSRRDSSDPGLPNCVPGFDKSGFGGIDRSSHSVDSEESMSLESVQHNPVLQYHEPTNTSPGALFNASEATQLVSNVQMQVRAGDLELDLGTVHSCTASMDSTIAEFAEMDVNDHMAKTLDRVYDKSDSISTLGTGANSHDGHGAISDSTANNNSVSRTSTLPSRRLPIGVDVSPPLEGVESDDLGVIFAAAAKRMG
jgi:hypothetical protein